MVSNCSSGSSEGSGIFKGVYAELYSNTAELQIVIWGPKCGRKIIAAIPYNSATGCNHSMAELISIDGNTAQFVNLTSPVGGGGNLDVVSMWCGAQTHC